MDTPASNRRQSARIRQSVSYAESPDYVKSPRKSLRTRTPNQKFQEIDTLLSKTPTKKKKKAENKEIPDPESSVEVISLNSTINDSYEKENLESMITKPSTLFEDEDDVEGKKLYSFKTPKKEGMMAQLANQTPKTPRHHDANKGTPKTPKNSRISEILKTPTSRPSAVKCTKTPRHVRDEMKKKLSKVTYDDDSDEDFKPNDSDESSSEEEQSDDQSSSDNEIKEEPKKRTQTVHLQTVQTSSTGLRRSKRNKTDYQYILQSDDFFSSHSTKNKTSDHTLDRLKTPRLPHDELLKLLTKMQVSKDHEQSMKEMNEEFKTYFDKWLTLFDEGFSILLHGLGSKRNLLQAFHKEKLEHEHVLVVNGFFPSLTIKDILDPIVNDLLELAVSNSNPHEVVNIIEEEMKRTPSLHVYLIIHNIDGTMLRNDKAQSVLSRLSSIKNIHMIASIDHINSPLLWNHTKLSAYNFQWFDVTSYLAYTDETAYENSLLINNSGNLELSSLRSVFQSLTTNARGIYILLVKHQLENSSNNNYQGMSFKNLYSMCREAFLVSSDIALRGQLTEFLDHKLAKMKRNIDGAENITIPISNNLLQKFMNEQN
ncbi:hypothetical protein PVAND_000748 [Polypedilum vanderplanki]|uniref:Origin recognition complex subunit 2 n=1 Tax=Polypedilum vanderplanki TaxID=319348 RepID=A0A9J6BM74_POLVA|nr:hypothetical protein PVAND_000748 [Polypedilum vanderplanki]